MNIATETLTKKQVDILLHTTGLDRNKTSTRNYYAGGGADMDSLVGSGHMWLSRAGGGVFPDPIYRATDKGMKAALESKEASK